VSADLAELDVGIGQLIGRELAALQAGDALEDGVHPAAGLALTEQEPHQRTLGHRADREPASR